MPALTAVDLPKPAKNAGMYFTATYVSVRSRSALAPRMTKTHGAGFAAFYPGSHPRECTDERRDRAKVNEAMGERPPASSAASCGQ
jgi:hypothetical protein